MTTLPFSSRHIADPEHRLPGGELVARIRAGDHDAFDTAFRAHYPLLRAVAARLATPAQAEEIVQDVFLSLWERRSSLLVPGALGTYLLSAVRFTAASSVRRAQVARRHNVTVVELHQPPAPSDEALLHEERVRVVRAAVDRLPPRCREVFELVRLEGLSYADTAAALGISPKTVDAQLGKALRRLRDDLATFSR